jgi:DNA replication ATP-dependent helicase Dna2
MTVVDEASQLTEPLTLGLVMRAPRFVLIGDDRQLPPVVRGAHLAVSMFERLKEVTGREAPENLTLLDRQYRMHPQIMDVSNRLFYSGALSSGVQEEDREPPYGLPVAFVPVDQASEGRTNPAEAHVVHRIVKSLLKTVPASDIGVISPFRAQVVLLRQLLDDAGVAADTVERFQGGEREVIVLSLVRSRSSGFVFDDRRFNVAITRARRKLILVGHPDLFAGTKYEWLARFTE